MDFRPSMKNGPASGYRTSRCTSVILAIIPGIIGFGSLLAAIALPQWMNIFRFTTSIFQVETFGLFSACFTQTGPSSTGTPVCKTREELAAGGKPIDILEQVTRSLVIISIILVLPATASAVYFGVRKNARRFSSLVPGGIFGLSALCAITGMACYSAYFVDVTSTDAGGSVQAATSFFLGWFGAVCVLAASVTSFASHGIY